MSSIENKMENKKLNANIILLIICALSFGISDYFSRLYLRPIFQSINLTSQMAIFLNLFYFRDLIRQFKEHKWLLGGVVLYIGISFSRYFLFYSTGFLILPFIRQLTALVFGLNILFLIKRLLRDIKLDTVSNIFIFTSIPIMLIGVIQHLSGFKVDLYPRITSLFDEPSYYGDYLIVIVAPFILYNLINFKKQGMKTKLFNVGVTLIWCFSMYAVQSGTALMKLATLTLCFIIYAPFSIRIKITSLALSTLILIAALLIGKSYTQIIFSSLIALIKEPKIFFEVHSFYDRFYPIYSATKNLFTLSGFIGIGFGGDYYEFYKLYPKIVHGVMLYTKPTYSYFNSFSSKIILYFGVGGLIWYYLQLKKIKSVKNFFVKICTLNAFIVTLWGLSNFSLPYIWLWIAIIDKTLAEETENEKKY